jgi:hypothetical protein
MTAPTVLVVAKAPVPGQAKTRVANTVGALVAADLAAAALLDTLEIVGSVGWPVVVAVTGDLDAASGSDALRAALAPFTVVEQRGEGFGERLAAAHEDADGGYGVVQVGMDTPQLSVDDLRDAGQALDRHEAVVAPADDGGWWLLALRSPIHAKVLMNVSMSRPDTCRVTVDALTEAGAGVGMLRPLSDVDNWEDAVMLAADYPHLRMSAVVRRVAWNGPVPR